jgi:membrane associated rhomboid family serine protease
MTTPPQTPTCYRHPDRATYVRCTRCNRFICPECMRDAAVGHQCADCVSAGARTVRQPKPSLGSNRTPVITYALIGINVVMFILQMASPDVQSMFEMRSLQVADGQLHRLLTSAFLHYGPMHIVFNMWALYIVGPPLEIALGRLRFSALYVMSALGGSVLVYLLSSTGASTAGASGAVFGLFGATFVIGKRLNMDVRWVVGLIAINLVITFVVPNLSWQGHIGGLLTGAVIAALYAYAPRNSRNAVQVGGIAALLVLFTALIWWRTVVLLSQFAFI